MTTAAITEAARAEQVFRRAAGGYVRCRILRAEHATVVAVSVADRL
jgi:hypothetical protein